MSNQNLYSLGLDIGNKMDFSVISLAHYLPSYCWIREITQLPLGTNYSKVVEGVCQIIKVLQTKGTVVMFCHDGTGGGDVFADFVAKKFDEYGIDCPRDPYVFTPSSKWQLITNMKMLHARGILRLEFGESYEKQRQVKMLIEEMRSYEFRRVAKPDGTFTDQLGVFGAGKHDDMVTSVALAVWHYQEYSGEAQDAIVGSLPDRSWITTPLGSAKDEGENIFGGPVTIRA